MLEFPTLMSHKITSVCSKINNFQQRAMINEIDLNNQVIISPRQRKNPLLKFVLLTLNATRQRRKVRGSEADVASPIYHQFPHNSPMGGLYCDDLQQGEIKHLSLTFSLPIGNIPTDFMISSEVSVLFLSLKYHRLHSNYIYDRINGVRQCKILNLFLLCQIDIADPSQILTQLTVDTFTTGCKILVSWNPHESAAIIEMLCLNHGRGIETMNRKVFKNHFEEVQELVSTVKTITTKNAYVICKKYRTLKEVMHFDPKSIQSIPGFGARKVEALKIAFKNEFY